jgi:hypothetical protein
MPVKAQSLRVRPNPWIFIDHKGRPAGRVAVEQPKGHYDPRTVGSRIGEAKLVAKAAGNAMLSHDVHDIVIEYDTEPVVVANTPYYRRRIMGGELIAADRDSFIAAGGRPKDFEDHVKHVESKKAEAIKQFELENGEGAFELLAKQREAEEKQAKAEAAAMAGETEAAAPAPTATKKGDDK